MIRRAARLTFARRPEMTEPFIEMNLLQATVRIRVGQLENRIGARGEQTLLAVARHRWIDGQDMPGRMTGGKR